MSLTAYDAVHMIATVRGGTTGTSALGLAVILAAGGQLLLDQRQAVPFAIGLCLAGVAMSVWSRTSIAGEIGPPAWSRREAAGFALLAGLALLIRLVANGAYPVGVTFDEATNGLEAKALLRNPTFPIWSDQLSGRATLHLHLVAGSFALFGVTAEVLRGVSAVFGTMTVIVLYLLARQLGGVALAFAAAGFLTISRWHVGYSRLGYEAIVALFCATLTLYLLVRALREQRLMLFTLAGATLAAGLYTYISYRLFPLALAPVALVALARAWRDRRRAVAVGLAAMCLAALITAAPLLRFASAEWSRFAGRFNEVSVLAQVRAAGSYAPLFENTARHLGMFNYRGGIRAATNLPEGDAWQPGVAMLGTPFAALFLIGLGRAIRQATSAPGALLLGTLVTSLAAGTLTVVEEGPHQTRALLALLPAAYFAGDGLIAVARLLSEHPRRLAATTPVLIAATIAGAAYVEGRTYWKQLHHAEAWWDFAGNWTASGRVLRDVTPGTQVYLSPTLQGFPAGAVVEFVSGIAPERLPGLRPVEHIPARFADRDVLYLLTPEDREYFGWGFAAAYPELTWAIGRDNYDRPLYAALLVPRDVAKRSFGLAVTDHRDQDCNGSPDAHAIEAFDGLGASAPAAGAGCRRWSGAAFVPSTGSYRLAIDDGAGKLWIDGVEVGESPLRLSRGFVGVQAQRPAAAGQWRLRWAHSGEPLADLPSEALFPRSELAGGLTGFYYPNAEFRGPARLVQRDWGFFPSGSPPPYSVSWRGSLLAPSDGQYRLTAGGDEGTQVIVGGQLVLDTDSGRGRPEATRTLTLSRGRHDIELRYFKFHGQGQSLQFAWQPPGGSGQERLTGAVLAPIADPLRDEPRNAVLPPRR